jgi:predicted MFS family arabinose efflux permease
MPVYLADIGFSASVGAVSISVIGLFNIFGAYYAGIFSDRAQMSRILVIIYVARAIVISLFLILPKSIVSVLVFSALIGLLWLATVPPTSGLVAKFFGTRYMTYLYGIVFFSHQVGSFTGVWLGGELYQRFGNYDGVWIAGILLGFMAALLHFYIDEQSYEYKISTTIS